MIFKWETKLISGLRYIVSSQMIDEMGVPDVEKGEYPIAFTQGLIDERGNPRWVIDDKDPTRVAEVLIPPTAEQLAAEHDSAVVQQIGAAYPASEEVKLLNSAIEALAAGKALPKEYLDYRIAIAAIKAKTAVDNGRG